MEHLVNEVGCRGMFSTHYHKLRRIILLQIPTSDYIICLVPLELELVAWRKSRFCTNWQMKLVRKVMVLMSPDLQVYQNQCSKEQLHDLQSWSLRGRERTG